MPMRIVSQRRTRTCGVLRQSIVEGSADFIAEVVTGHHHSYPYGEAHAAALWTAFQRDMHARDY